MSINKFCELLSQNGTRWGCSDFLSEGDREFLLYSALCLSYIDYQGFQLVLVIKWNWFKTSDSLLGLFNVSLEIIQIKNSFYPHLDKWIQLDLNGHKFPNHLVVLKCKKYSKSTCCLYVLKKTLKGQQSLEPVQVFAIIVFREVKKGSFWFPT